MPIVGLTHEKDGSPRIHRTVNCKVAIGLAPDEDHNYPRKLDHFAFLKLDDSGLKWVIDEQKQDHFGDDCASFWIVLIDDDPDVLFRTELAAYVQTQCWCRGDGERALRREMVDGKHQGDFKIWTGPCANNGCPEIDSKCKPSGDLYFMMADYPTLGTVCRIHTSSYQSIRQISSALRDLQAVTGGRLMGVRCKLFVMPAKATYTQGNQKKTATKWVLGLELAAKDVPELMATMASTAVMFQGLQKQLSGRVLEVVEEDDERSRELKPEFYPDEEAPEEASVVWTEEEREAYVKKRIAELKSETPNPELASEQKSNGKDPAKVDESGLIKLINACRNAADFNAILPTIKAASDVTKMAMMAAATKFGVAFDKAGKRFVDTAASAPLKPSGDTQAPPKPEASVQQAPAAQEQASKDLIQQELKVTDAERRNKKPNGVFWLLTCRVDGAEADLMVHVWHKSLHEAVSKSVGKVCDFGLTRTEKDDAVYYALEEIYSIGEQKFVDNKPSVVPDAGQLGFE